MLIYVSCVTKSIKVGIDLCKTCSSRYPFWMRSSISFRDLKILKSESQLKGQCSTWVDNSFFQMESFGVSHPIFDVSMFLMCPYFQCFNVINDFIVSMFQLFQLFNVFIVQMFQCFQYFNDFNDSMFSMVSMFPTQESWGHLPMISSRPFPVIWVPCRGLDYDNDDNCDDDDEFVELCGTLLYIDGWWDRWS